MIATGCKSAPEKDTATNGAPIDTVRIAATVYAGTCPILIARANGDFASEGIAAEIEFEASGRATLQSAMSGHADLATVADVPIMFAVTSGQPVAVVATISSAQQDHSIVARRDRGIDAPASLRGKRIGVPLGTSAHFFLDAFLNRQALAPGDVTLRDMRPEELAPALQRGDVDAIAVWQPFVNESVRELGSNAISFHGESVYDVVYTMAGTRQYVAAHSKLVERVLRATIRGARFCSGNPAAARAELAAAGKVNEGYLASVWPAYRFEVVLRQGLILALEDETRWAMRSKLTPATELPNYLTAIALEPLQAVSPAAVSVIH